MEYARLTAAVRQRLIFRCHICPNHVNVNGRALKNHYLHHGYPDIRRPNVGYEEVIALPQQIAIAVQNNRCFGCPYCFQYLCMPNFDREMLGQHIQRHVNEGIVSSCGDFTERLE